MAKRKPKPKAAPTNSDKDLVTRVRKRYEVMAEADQSNRQKAMDDLKFVNEPGAQWDSVMKKFRGDRPCYEFNELRLKCKRIINDMRANRPQAKIRGYEDSTKKTAEIIEGLGRNIWNCSDGDTIVDLAGEYQVAAGMAAWRVTTDYETDESFDQDIYIEGIKNPFCLYCDPAAKDPLKRDAQDWILTEKITRAAYELKYPNARVVDFDEGTQFDDDDDWGTGTDSESEQVRIAEYWYKEPVDVELWKLKDGKVVDASDEAAKFIPPDQIAQKRTVKGHNIMMTIVSGDAVLEPPQVCAGKQHRFVMIYGESLVIDGKTQWFGLPRFAKDAQRNLNITQTAALESTAANLQSKFWATHDQALGNVDKWKQAIQENIPFALYNPDPKAPGPPQRMAGPEVPVAMLQLGQAAHSLINTTTGIFEASQGAPSNEQTGRAILARQQQGEISTFNYQDNMSKGIQRTWEIFIDLIPEVYDTERSLRILGSDGAEDFVKVNTFVMNDQGQPVKINDLNVGRYDVTITTGPNFSTKRQEASETYGQLAQQFPQLMAVAGDLVMKSMDLPYSEDIADRLKTLLPAPIQQMLNQDKQQDPQVAQAMLQVQQAAQQVQQQGQLVQQAAQELEQQKALSDKQKAEIQTSIANLKTQQAQFDADVAKQMAALRIAQVDAEQAIAMDQNAQERQDLSAELANSVAEIKQMSAAFMQNAVQTMADIQSKQAPMVVMPNRPKIVAIHAKRVNGELQAVPQYEGDQPQVNGPITPGPMKGPMGPMSGGGMMQ
jgi:hypothetical protein